MVSWANRGWSCCKLLLNRIRGKIFGLCERKDIWTFKALKKITIDFEQIVIRFDTSVKKQDKVYLPLLEMIRRDAFCSLYCPMANKYLEGKFGQPMPTRRCLLRLKIILTCESPRSGSNFKSLSKNSPVFHPHRSPTPTSSSPSNHLSQVFHQTSPRPSPFESFLNSVYNQPFCE